jgi:predicted MPP superfamily phosphohydrolase
VRFPFVGSPIVPSRFGQRFAAGHVIEGGRHLFVATGVGTSILPVRFRVPPAVNMLTLVPDRPDGSSTIRRGLTGHAGTPPDPSR